MPTKKNLRPSAKSAGRKKDSCPACGLKWINHTGIEGTCKSAKFWKEHFRTAAEGLIETRAHIAELRAEVYAIRREALKQLKRAQTVRRVYENTLEQIAALPPTRIGRCRLLASTTLQFVRGVESDAAKKKR